MDKSVLNVNVINVSQHPLWVELLETSGSMVPVGNGLVPSVCELLNGGYTHTALSPTGSLCYCLLKIVFSSYETRT